LKIHRSGLDEFSDKWVPVTTAWRVLRLRMEERPPIWRIHWISSRGQSTSGGPPAWGLGEVPTTPSRQNYHVTKCSHRDRDRWWALV